MTTNESDDSAAETAERARRVRVLKGAQAAFNREHSAVPCVVRDLSETGAKIEFDLGWVVPSTFTLFVEIDGFKVECEKVWHRGNLYGVRFVGPRTPSEIVRRQRIDLYDMRGEPQAPEAAAAASAPRPAVDNRPKRPVFGKLK